MLYIYDGENDGDTIYVRVQWWEAGYPDDTTYWVSGTSKELDMSRIQLDGDDDIDENHSVFIKLYDDKELTDPVTGWYTARA